MPSQHKNPMLGWRPPAELSAWARAESERREVDLSVVLTEALSEYRAKHDPSDPGEDQRAPVSELLGADRDWCGGQSVDDYVREQRR